MKNPFGTFAVAFAALVILGTTDLNLLLAWEPYHNWLNQLWETYPRLVALLWLAAGLILVVAGALTSTPTTERSPAPQTE